MQRACRGVHRVLEACGGSGDSKTQACIEWAAWIILLLLLLIIIIILICIIIIIVCWQGAGRG